MPCSVGVSHAFQRLAKALDSIAKASRRFLVHRGRPGQHRIPSAPRSDLRERVTRRGQQRLKNEDDVSEIPEVWVVLEYVDVLSGEVLVRVNYLRL